MPRTTKELLFAGQGKELGKARRSFGELFLHVYGGQFGRKDIIEV